MLLIVYSFSVRILHGNSQNPNKGVNMSVSTDSIYSSAYYTYNSIYNTSSTSDSTSKSQSSEFADLLMPSLDSDSSGSIDVTEFSEAALSLSSSSVDEDAINEAFSLLDDDDDGTISLDELTSYMASGLQNEQTQAAGSPPPPPPPSEEDDSGYTQDELSALASDTSSVDANLAALFETLASNFDEADANGDGEVSATEAMTYQEQVNQQELTETEIATQTEETSSTDEVKQSFVDTMLQQLIAQYYMDENDPTSTLSVEA
jgi:hypothetical protein